MNQEEGKGNCTIGPVPWGGGLGVIFVVSTTNQEEGKGNCTIGPVPWGGRLGVIFVVSTTNQEKGKGKGPESDDQTSVL